MKTFLIILFCCLSFCAFSQVSEDFSDNDFTQNPVWQGSTTLFAINAAKQLQSKGPSATSTIYLSTNNTLSQNTEWNFLVNLAFSPSNTNYTKIYLISDKADLSSSLNGYYIRIGANGTTDAVDLYRQNGTTSTKILAGIAGRVAVTPKVRVKVTRNSAGNWIIYSDNTGGSNFLQEGTITDNTFTSTGFFGVSCIFTTANRNGFIFDDLSIKNLELPPTLQSASVIIPTQIDVLFSKNLDAASANIISNYAIPGLSINSAQLDFTIKSLVHLTLSSSLKAGYYTLSVSNVKDLFNNSIAANSTVNFNYFGSVPEVGDIIINEFLADESPSIGLPDAEFVELYNRTDKILNLTGLQFTDPTTTAAFPTMSFLPKSYIILCSTSNVSKFISYGLTVGLSNFPSLNNDGDDLTLKSLNGKVLDYVSYKSSWYRDSQKDDGGWTLERIDSENICGGAENWAASEDVKGGTPAGENSIKASNPDLSPPQLINVSVENAQKIICFFNEKVDTNSLKLPESFLLDKSNSIVSAKGLSPDFKSVELVFLPDLLTRTIYTLSVQNVKDPCGNNIDIPQKIQFALPEQGDSTDIVLNEILFNPKPNGVDFVEIYNRSDKFVDLQNWKLGRIYNGLVDDTVTFASQNYIIFPGQYLALTSDGKMLKSQYPKARDENFLITRMPAYNDDEGSVLLFNNQKKLIDQFDYKDDFHFKLLDDKEGVSLERISVDKTGNSPENWHSAAETEGFATPGYKNSQAVLTQNITSDFTILPKIFSPDDDGYQDFTTFNYRFNNVGNVANISIFDANGREVKRIARNQSLAIEGFFQWDGVNDKNEKVRTGIYVVLVQLFNVGGTKQEFKETVVVGAKLK